MKINLGCGSKILPGWTNLDKFSTYKPDIVHDLEVFPYPFKDNSVEEILSPSSHCISPTPRVGRL